MRTLRIGFLFCIGISAVEAQGSQQLDANRKIDVYFQDFALANADSVGRDVASFAGLNVTYSLLRNPSIRVARKSAPACPSPGKAQSKDKSKAQKEDFVAGIDDPVSRGFFAVHGSVERAGSDSAYLVDVEVGKCTRIGFSQVFHHTTNVSRSTLAAELPAIAEEVTDRIQFNAKLGIHVAVSGDSLLRNAIKASLLGYPFLRPEDSLFDIRLSVKPVSRGLYTTSLDFGLNIAPITASITIPADKRSLSQAADEIAAQTSRAVSATLLGLEKVPGRNNKESAVAAARGALCLGEAATDCRTSPEAALAALTSTGPLLNRDAELMLLYGRSKLAAGEYGAAVKTLRAADSLIRTNPYSVRPADVTSRTAHQLIANAYRSAGNYSDAATEYRFVLKFDPADTVTVLALAETLRSAGRHMEALATLKAWMVSNPRSASMRRATYSLLMDMSPRFLVDSVAAVRQICMLDPALRGSCAQVYAERGIESGRRRAEPADTRTLLDSALSFGIADSSVVVESALRLAALAVDVIQFPLGPGGIIRVPGYDRAMAVKNLALAEERMTSSTPVDQREWMNRISAIVLAADGDLAGAYAGGLKAMATKRTVASTRLTAHIAIAAAFANPIPSGPPGNGVSKRWLQEARMILDSGVKRFAADRSMPRLLLVLCENFLDDLRCAFEAGRMLVDRGISEIPDLIEVVEAAVLANEYQTGRSWLAKVQSQQLAGCNKSLAEFFAFWGSLQIGDQPAAKTAFEAWRKSLSAVPAAAPIRNCWDFAGAKKVLARTNAPPWYATLSGMIETMMNPAVPSPAWPASGLNIGN